MSVRERITTVLDDFGILDDFMLGRDGEDLIDELVAVTAADFEVPFEGLDQVGGE